MNFKVYNGTPPDQHLCTSCCSSVTRVEGGRSVTLCREMPAPHAVIHGKVTECSSYCNRDAARIMNDHQSRAWHLDLDEDGKFVYRTPADRENPVYRRSYRRRNPTRVIPSDPDPGSNPGPTVQ